MAQQVLDQVVIALPTYKEYMADITARGWLRYYEQGLLEIVQSAQRLTSPEDGRAEYHPVTPQEIEGISVAYINSSGYVSIVHEATAIEDAFVVDTILPWYLVTKLTFRNMFFEFCLNQIDRTLCLSDVVLDKAYFRATR